MIYYNMRYRGPYEYDKFTLNILNYVNFVNDYIADIENYNYNTDGNSEYMGMPDGMSLKTLVELVDEAFEKTMEHSESVYQNLIMNKGGV